MRRITIIALSVAAFAVSAAPASAAVVGQACNGPAGTGACGPLHDDAINVCRPIGPPVIIANSAWNSSSSRTIWLYASAVTCLMNSPLTVLTPGAYISVIPGGATFYKVT